MTAFANFTKLNLFGSKSSVMIGIIIKVCNEWFTHGGKTISITWGYISSLSMCQIVQNTETTVILLGKIIVLKKNALNRPNCFWIEVGASTSFVISSKIAVVTKIICATWNNLIHVNVFQKTFSHYSYQPNYYS